MKPETVALFGLPISNVTMAEAVRRVEQSIVSGATHQIATANLDFARNALRDGELQEIICGCSMVLPDGAPMLWASRLFRKPLQERVTGVDLIPHLARLSADRGYGIFLLGSTERSSSQACERLQERFPGVRIVGRYCPEPAPLEEMDDASMLARIAEARPAILLVAFGNPKQEMWIHRNRHRLQVPVAIGIGGALDMIAGSVARAPQWVRRIHMEWFFRMAQEPFRLLPRYAKDALALIRHLPLEVAVHRMQPGRRPVGVPRKVSGTLRVQEQGGVRVVGTPLTLDGEVCRGMVAEAVTAVRLGQPLVVDLTETQRIEADGLGALLEVRRHLLGAGRQVWLTGMSLPVRRVLQYSAISDLFRQATEPVDAVRSAQAAASLPAVRRGAAVPWQEMERQTAVHAKVVGL